MLFFIGSLAGLISLFIPLILKQSENLSLLDIESLQINIEKIYNQVLNYLEIKPFDATAALKNSKLLSKIDFSVIPDLLNSLIGSLGNFSIGLLSVLFITFSF